MLFRKIGKTIENHIKSGSKQILLIDGARQVGKTYIVRTLISKLFKNYIEINMLEDSLKERYFENVKTVEDFYIQVSAKAGAMLGEKEDTLIFIDEIQAYPHLLTLLKFLAQDNRYTYIASGSLLGVCLAETTSIPMGSIKKIQMYPMDFEEFLIANNVGKDVIDFAKKKFANYEELDEALHNRFMDLFRKYLLVGGMPAAVADYCENKNIQNVRDIQNEIHEYYGIDASKYDAENKLSIRRIYNLIPSNMENKKKRVVVKEIDNTNRTFEYYQDEFEYLISSGITLEARAISNPTFPLIASTQKNLLKLYINDVGILTAILFGNNIRPILDDELSINLGSVYETVVASELCAHGHKLFYYDNKKHGEVDFLIDSYDDLSVMPIEVKSGKDYYIHHAITEFTKNKSYGIKKAMVLTNDRHITTDEDGVIHMPIYNVMFF